MSELDELKNKWVSHDHVDEMPGLEVCIYETGLIDGLEWAAEEGAETLAKLRVDLEEEKVRNELFEDCLHRALERWQMVYPGKEFWPDGAANLAWVFVQLTQTDASLSAAQKQNAELRNALENTAHQLDMAGDRLLGADLKAAAGSVYNFAKNARDVLAKEI